MPRPTVLLLLAFLAPATARSQQAVPEPESGVLFPAALPGREGDSLMLMGTGIRTRTVFRVKVYAFGLYVDPIAAKRHLTAFAGIPHYELEKRQAFYDVLLGLNFTMALRLVMTRTVSADDMVDAFDGALRPRVRRAAREMSLPGGVSALDTFRGFFNVGELTEGAELVFTCTPDGTLYTRIKDAPSPEIANRALCWALFDVYLGRDPISESAKRSVVLGFPNLLYERN